jgi:hypothetical protein
VSEAVNAVDAPITEDAFGRLTGGPEEIVTESGSAGESAVVTEEKAAGEEDEGEDEVITHIEYA